MAALLYCLKEVTPWPSCVTSYVSTYWRLVHMLLGTLIACKCANLWDMGMKGTIILLLQAYGYCKWCGYPGLKKIINIMHSLGFEVSEMHPSFSINWHLHIPWSHTIRELCFTSLPFPFLLPVPPSLSNFYNQSWLVYYHLGNSVEMFIHNHLVINKKRLSEFVWLIPAGWRELGLCLMDFFHLLQWWCVTNGLQIKLDE